MLAVLPLLGTGTADALPPAPTVTTLSPISGDVAGGTAVTITGTNFTGATGVSFGGTAATGVTVLSSTSITATSPALATIATATDTTVDVTVTTGGGTSSTGIADEFTYTYQSMSCNTPASGSNCIVSAFTSTPTTNALTAETTNGTSVTLNATANEDLGCTAGTNGCTYTSNSGLSLVDVTDAAAPVTVDHVNGPGTDAATTPITFSVPANNNSTHRYVAEIDHCPTFPTLPLFH